LAGLSFALPLPSKFGELLAAGPAQAAAGGPAGAAVLVVASGVVWPLLLWGGTVLAVGAATRLPGRAGCSAVQLLRRLLPAALRPVLVAGLGVSIGVGTVGCATTGPPAGASSARVAAPEGDAAARAGDAAGTMTGLHLDWPSEPGPARIAVVRTLPDLDWPVSPTPAAQPTPPVPPVARAARPASVPVTAHRAESRPAAGANDRTASSAPRNPLTVRPGDTLWAIAAAHLPAGADDAEIDRGWRAWYVANATVIGPDPDLILPGQHLLPPTTKDAS